MPKLFTYLLICICFSLKCYGQKVQIPDPDPLRVAVDKVFDRVNLDQVPSAFLEEYGLQYISLAPYNGVLSDSNLITRSTLQMAYTTLISAQVRDNHILPSPAQFAGAWDEQDALSEANPVAVVLAEYHGLKPDALDKNLLRWENDQLMDVNTRLENPYRKQWLYMAAPARSYTRDGKLSLLFPSSLRYNSGSRSIRGVNGSLHIDWGEGQGYRRSNWDQVYTHQYLSPGQKVIRVKVYLNDGTFRACSLPIEVLGVPSPNASAQTGGFSEQGGSSEKVYPADDLRTIPFIIPAVEGVHSGALIRLMPSIRRFTNNRPRLVKPLIVVEGYDISSRAPRLQDNYTYEDFIEDINETGLNGYDFNQQLDDIGGYDICFVNFDDGADDLLSNAAVLQDALSIILREQEINPETGILEPNVIMGISMGGVIARYTLANLTKTNSHLSRNTRLLITHDSPHQGANIPVGLQFLIRAARDSRKLSDLIENENLRDLEAADEVLDAPATRQLLKYWVDGDNYAIHENTFLEELYRPMITFGPSDPTPAYQIIATSQGAECGEEDIAPGTELFRVIAGGFGGWPFLATYNLKTDIVSNAIPAVGQRGRVAKFRLYQEVRVFGFRVWGDDYDNRELFINPGDGILPWDSAPGGRFPVLSQLGVEFPAQFINRVVYLRVTLPIFGPDFCFVPTVSALDIANGESPAVLNQPFHSGLSLNAPSLLLQNSPIGSFGEFITNQAISQNGETIFNTTHARFTARQTQWLFEMMQAPFPIQQGPSTLPPCPNSCQLPEPLSFDIVGETYLCGNPQIYSIDPIPGARYEWEVSDNLEILVGQGTPNLGVNAIGQGEGKITLHINSRTCQDLLFKEMLVYSDLPSVPRFTQTKGNLCPGESFEYEVRAEPFVNSWEWELRRYFSHGQFTSITLNSQSNRQALGYFDLGPSLNVLRVRPQNGCGEGPWATYSIYPDITDRCGGVPIPIRVPGFVIYPNPAEEDLYIEQEASSNTHNPLWLEGQKSALAFSVYLYNNQGEQVMQAHSAEELLALNVSSLPGNLYVLVLVKGGEVHEILIQVN